MTNLRHIFKDIPSILAPFWFGFWGAIATLIMIYFLREGLSLTYYQLVEAGLFFLIAIMLVYLAEMRRREHRARLNSERLAAVGMAVSEITHDMKTPLIAIGGFAAQLRRRMGENDPDRAKIDLVIKETARLESMVKDILNFSRPLRLRTSSCNLSRIAEECMEMMRCAESKRGVALEEEFDPSLPDCMLDKDGVKEVFINLIANAVQASPPGRTVTVRTLRRGRKAVLEVSDRGHGIPDADRERIFSPFFSRKKGGTGLGLTIARKIVTAHGGTISFCQNPDRGVTFRVALPLKSGRHLLSGLLSRQVGLLKRC